MKNVFKFRLSSWKSTDSTTIVGGIIDPTIMPVNKMFYIKNIISQSKYCVVALENQSPSLS